MLLEKRIGGEHDDEEESPPGAHKSVIIDQTNPERSNRGGGVHDEGEDSEAEVGIVVLDQVEQDQVHSPLPKTILEFRNQRNHTIYQPFSPCVTAQHSVLHF